LETGTIKEVIGLEKILENPAVVSYVPVHNAGDHVEATGNYGQMLGRFNIVCKDEKELDDLLKQIYDTVKVISTDGTDLIEGRYAAVSKV
jgi:uncharacterized membrane-anchored protein